ncbi:hypothetical protein EAF04_007095 [Stromatinia cepivora]|nr:hypothetical protein EAF04_007095 [Stromatinia cepivora]
MDAAHSISRFDNDNMNDQNRIEAQDMASSPLKKSGVSNDMGVESLKRKHGVEDLEYDADTEGDSKRPHKTRRGGNHDPTLTSQILGSSRYRGSVASSHQEATRGHREKPIFNNSAHEHVEINKQQDIHSEPKQADDSSNAGNDNLTTLDWSSDYDDEERIASSIIQKRNANSNGETKPFLPRELVIDIFEIMIRLPRKLESWSNPSRNSESNFYTSTDGEDGDSESSTNDASGSDGEDEDNKAGEDNGGMIDAICFALSCPRYWIIFRDLWCYPGTNRILDEFELPMTQQLILAPLLETWIGPKYRRSYLLIIHPHMATRVGKDGSQGYINMFLARKVYGTGESKGNSLKELSLWKRYKARSQILDCSGPNLESFGDTSNTRWKADSPKVRLLSPFGMGSTWYFAAAKQYRDLFMSWRFEYSDLCLFGMIHSNPMISSWRSFLETSISNWVRKYKAPMDPSHPSPTQLVMEEIQVVRDIIELDGDVIHDIAIDRMFDPDDLDSLLRDEFPEDEYEEREMRIMCLAIILGDGLLREEDLSL